MHADEYLGTLEPERLLALFHDRRETTEEQIDLGSTAWEAFRSPDPTAVLGVIEAGAQEPFPFLASALRRHLEQFPSTANGLSRSEEQALEAIAGGSNTSGEAFAAYQEREEPVFLSDAVFRLLPEGPQRSEGTVGAFRMEAGQLPVSPATLTRCGRICGTRKSCLPRRAVRCSVATKTACA